MFRVVAKEAKQNCGEVPTTMHTVFMHIITPLIISLAGLDLRYRLLHHSSQRTPTFFFFFFFLILFFFFLCLNSNPNHDTIFRVICER